MAMKKKYKRKLSTSPKPEAEGASRRISSGYKRELEDKAAVREAAKAKFNAQFESDIPLGADPSNEEDQGG